MTEAFEASRLDFGDVGLSERKTHTLLNLFDIASGPEKWR